MLEMSCGNIEVIHEYLYLYVYGTGYNDREVDADWQQSIARLVKKSYPKYQCDPKYLPPQ
jgi:predicted N-acyltransferase